MKKWLQRLGFVTASLLLVFFVWFWLMPNAGHPRTVDQSVERLLETLSGDGLDGIAGCEESDLIGYHLTLGKHIRNEHGLWSGNLRLAISTGHLNAIVPDYASGYILHALWKELRSGNTSKSEVEADEAFNKLLRDGQFDSALASLKR